MPTPGVVPKATLSEPPTPTPSFLIEEENDLVQKLSQHFILRREIEAEIAKQLSLYHSRFEAEGQVPVSCEQEQNLAGSRERRRSQALRTTTAGHGHRAGQLTEYTLEESIWDACIFIGTPEIGNLGSLILLLVLFINILMQVLCIVIIEKNLVAKTFSEQRLRGLEAWRNQIGHDLRFVSPRNGFSLVDRVCARDQTLEVANDSMQKLDLVRKYLPEDTQIFSGPAMCVLALTIWAMCCLREVFRTLDYMRAVLCLPISQSEVHMFAASELVPCGLRLSQMCRQRQLFALSVALARLAVVGAMLVVGLGFLVYTVSISDLILNAMALELVMNIDDLIYAVAIPARVAALTRKLDPLPMRPWRDFRGVDLKAALAPLLLSGCLIVIWFTLLRDSIENIRGAGKILCDGNRSFGFELDGLGVVRIRDLPEYNTDVILNDRSLASQAVNETAWSTASQQFGLPAELRVDGTIFSQILNQEEMDDMMATVTTLHRGSSRRFCDDSLFWSERPAEWDVLQKRIAEDLDIQVPVVNCSQVEPHCQWKPGQSHRAAIIVRALCPSTCGCNSLIDGTAFVAPEMGCPLPCLYDVREWKREAECKDLNFTDEGDPRFEGAWRLIRELEQAWQFNKLSLPVADLFLTMGCRAATWLRGRGSGDVCQPYDDRLYARLWDGDPLRGRTVKLLTVFCPKECNCDGSQPGLARAPVKFCPEQCFP